MSYQHLSLAERYYIEIERKMKVSINQIATAMGRCQSTISREINRNTGHRGYRHKQANRFAEERHMDKPKAVKLTDEIKYLLSVCIKADWSPEQIAGRFQEEGVMSLHHETVYQYILTDKVAGGLLYKHLRHQAKTYRKRYSAHNANGLLRQYFPKSMELVDISIEQVVEAVDKLNSRPRKCLNFKTPYEVFEELTGVDVRKIMGYALIT